VLFRSTGGAASDAFGRALTARGHSVRELPLDAERDPALLSEATLVAVDLHGALEAGRDLLTHLAARPRAGAYTLIGLTPREHLATATASGADELLGEDIPDDVLGIRIELAERRAESERVRIVAEEAMKESNANLSALIENIEDFVLFSDRTGSPVVFNAAYAKVMNQLLGIEMKPGIKPHELLPPEEQRPWDEYHRRVLSGERLHATYAHPLPDGSYRYFEISYNPVRKDGEVIGFSELTRDVTERRNAERAVQDANDALERKVAERTVELERSNRALRQEVATRQRTEEALRAALEERRNMAARMRQAEKLTALGQLAGGIAHDFNNQLVGISVYADLLARDSPKPEHRAHAQVIKRATERSADLVAKLLAFARKGKQESVPLDLHALIADVIELLHRSIDKRIAIESHLDAADAVTIGDQALLHSALLNLGLNARDAMPDGGTLTFSTRVVALDEQASRAHPDDLAPGDYLAIEVRDTGGGMDANTMVRIFEPFFTTKETGTGMGLAAVYGAVRSHHGAIEVDSEPGRGTAVELLLPLAATTRPAATASPAPIAATAGASILVVDDEALVRDMLALVLEDMGHQVTTCDDGERALAHYRNHWRSIDLVIFDMIMPKLNGLQLFEEMRRINPRVKGLLSSGFALQEDSQPLHDTGALGLLQKPYGVDDVITKVRSALAR